jgi:hypothetical protein
MKDTTEMAREVKMPYDFLTGEPINLEKLKAFEALVRADEREACAKIQFESLLQAIRIEREACAKLCDAKYEEFPNEQHDLAYALSAKELAAAIRARGNT